MTTKEKVAAIEKFPIWLNTKSELLLVIAGFKPAITVSVDGKVVSCKKKAPLPSLARTHAIENLLTKIGLTFITLSTIHRNWPEDDEQYYTTIICIGNSPRDAKDLARVWTNITNKGYPAKSQDKEHGRLSGFPKTAIDAFTSNNPEEQLLSFRKSEQKIANLYYKNFCQMRLSRKQWQQELKSAQQWADAVRSMSPKVYSSMTAVRSE